MREYEAVPYDSEPFPETHPGRLAAIGRFFGMNPAPIQSARILELGCAAGNNLIPMAHAMPDATLLGIDTTESAIKAGHALVEQLGLKNIRLEPRNLLELVKSDGPFDYVIAHGLFSWVTPEVQERIFAVTAELLAPEGIAYISYNAFPGWHLRLLMRELLLFSTDGLTDTKSKIDRARSVAKLMEQGLSRRSAPFPKAVAEQLKLLDTFPDWYFYHDVLEGENRPEYLNRFVDRARHHGLQYLGDSDLQKMSPHDIPEGVRRGVGSFANSIEDVEQYLDFYRLEMFRRTLLCRGEVKLTRGQSIERIGDLRYAARVRLASAELPGRFEFEDGRIVETGDEVMQRALTSLGAAWPRSLSYDELHQGIADLNGDLAAEKVLIQGLFQSLLAGHVEARVGDSAEVSEISSQPIVAPLIRVQALAGPKVTTLHHRLLILDDYSRAVACRLDGSRALDAVVQELKSLRAEGALPALPDDQEELELLQRTVQLFCEEALLVG